VNRGALIRLTALSLVAGAVAVAVAYFVPWLPEDASVQRGRIDFIFWLTTGICVFIFSLVASLLVYSVIRFRVKPDDDSDGAPIHGNTGLEIAWTTLPTILVTIIAIASAIVLAKNGEASSNHVNVDVTARQFVWSFKYPDAKNLASVFLRIPKGRATVLHIRALDVIHSFWVPQFGQKQDAVPGIVTRLVITPTKVGTFPIICTELCGIGHAFMRSRVIVMKPAAFDAWISKQTKTVSPAGGGGGPAKKAAGRAVFVNNGCGACHTYKPAGAHGKVGPDLDKLVTYAKQAHKPLAAFTRESIVKPNAYIQKGYPANVMPQTFGQLPKTQLDALVQYLVGAPRGNS
jgi:cytochrome c oxidase subunit 2